MVAAPKKKPEDLMIKQIIVHLRFTEKDYEKLKEICFNFQKNSWWNKKKSSTWPKIWFYLILGFIFFTNWNIMLQILHKVIFYNRLGAKLR